MCFTSELLVRQSLVVALQELHQSIQSVRVSSRHYVEKQCTTKDLQNSRTVQAALVAHRVLCVPGRRN